VVDSGGLARGAPGGSVTAAIGLEAGLGVSTPQRHQSVLCGSGIEFDVGEIRVESEAFSHADYAV